MRRVISAVLVIVLPVVAVQAQTAREIVKQIDELYRSESSYAVMEMEIVTPHWQRTLRMRAWTQGTGKTFIRITEPAKERGVTTLRMGNEMWNYLPNTNKVIKVPPSMMMSSWMGSDFTNNDLVSEFTLLEDYNFELIQPDTAQSGYLYIEAVPREGKPIVWGKQIITVREEDYIPIRQEYYDENGKLMRVLKYQNIREFDGKEIPTEMIMIPKNKEGNRTIIRYLDADFNIDVSEDIFSLRNLRSQ